MPNWLPFPQTRGCSKGFGACSVGHRQRRRIRTPLRLPRTLQRQTSSRNSVDADVGAAPCLRATFRPCLAWVATTRARCLRSTTASSSSSSNRPHRRTTTDRRRCTLSSSIGPFRPRPRNARRRRCRTTATSRHHRRPRGSTTATRRTVPRRFPACALNATLTAIRVACAL